MVSTIFLSHPHNINITKFQKVQANLIFFYKRHIKNIRSIFLPYSGSEPNPRALPFAGCMWYWVYEILGVFHRPLAVPPTQL